MEITVAVKVDHLPSAYNAPIPTPASDKLRTILVPNVDYKGTVEAILNDCSCCFHQIEREGHWRTSTTDVLARQCPTILGVAPLTPVAAIKHALQGLTGIPMEQQLLSSVGCVMHDEFLVNDYDGLNTLYQDSILDLSKSGKFTLPYFLYIELDR
ncbi:unnamed protein product [Sphagnum balticum]